LDALAAPKRVPGSGIMVYLCSAPWRVGDKAGKRNDLVKLKRSGEVDG
jgi:hypothetical protein